MTAQHDPGLARADHLLTAEELRAKYSNKENGFEHTRFLKQFWKAEVAAGNTLCGYWEYVEATVERAHEWGV